jgi:RimJ/RimL family protein N-acetyltransferase
MYRHKNGIILRKVSQFDASNLFDLKLGSWSQTHNSLFVNLEDQKNWIDKVNQSNNDYVFIASLKENSAEVDVAVGLITQVDWISRSAYIAGSVFNGYLSKGYSKNCFEAGVDFAFEMLNLQRLNAEVMQYNAAAFTIDVEHLGFKVEGIKRKAVYKCGQYYDSILLGLLREEWETQPRVQALEGCCNRMMRLDKIEDNINYIKGKL